MSGFSYLGTSSLTVLAEKRDGIDTCLIQKCDGIDTSSSQKVRRDRHVSLTNSSKLSTGSPNEPQDHDSQPKTDDLQDDIGFDNNRRDSKCHPENQHRVHGNLLLEWSCMLWNLGSSLIRKFDIA